MNLDSQIGRIGIEGTGNDNPCTAETTETAGVSNPSEMVAQVPNNTLIKQSKGTKSQFAYPNPQSYLEGI